MLYVFRRSSSETLATTGIILEVDVTFTVWDSEDGTIEKHNGYEIKYLESQMPGIFHNVTVKDNFTGYCTDSPIPEGIYPIYGTEEKMVVSDIQGIHVYANGYLYKVTTKSGLPVSRSTIVLKDSDGYYTLTLNASKELTLKYIGEVSMVQIKRSLLIGELDSCIEELSRR